MSKKINKEFDMHSANRNLRAPEVTFSITNPRLDDIFNMEFGPTDYIEKDGGIYYMLTPNEFDRFIDFAIASGFDVDRYVNQVEDLSEEGSVTGGEAFLPSLHAPKKKINPFKESEDPYRIEVAVSDARKALDIVRSDRMFSNNVKIYSSNLFIGTDASIMSELFDEFEKLGIQMVSYNIPGEVSDFYESILSGYEEVTGFRPGHTPDKGGFQYKDLWDMNEDACWSGYQQIGMKDKGGKQVPNCVPVNENYAQFRNSTKTRSGSEQYHQAVKLVKKKVQEISKLHSYMERMQQELSETQDGLKKKKYTQMAIDKIKAEIKELNKKVRKLK